LLLGALLQSQALRHIQIESVEIILHKGDKPYGRPQDRNENSLLLVNASLFVTFSIPNLEQGGPFSSKVAGKGRKRVTAVPNVTKMVHTSIQSNWHKLEKCDFPKLTQKSLSFANDLSMASTANNAECLPG
jgi:hypothetical protein